MTSPLMSSRVKSPGSSGGAGCSGFSWQDQARFVSEDDGVHAVSRVQVIRTRATCVFTVASLMISSLAIWLLDRPGHRGGFQISGNSWTRAHNGLAATVYG